ncbi:MAG: methyltransferase domain-containing protein [Clostridia bacterium]|nr:methyltransferase domain-containing protein [Clostridia bacterium]
MEERLRFLKRFLHSPSSVGSITPSSSFLAKKMVKEEEVEPCLNIIELGAGTGVFTKHLMQMKTSETKLYVFEKDPLMAANLQRKYSDIKIFPDATQIGKLLNKGELSQTDLVISGLPFAVMPDSVRQKILRGVFQVLRPGGKFVAFQYSFQLLKELERIYGCVDLEFVLLNIPPAVVYRCTKVADGVKKDWDERNIV